MVKVVLFDYDGTLVYAKKSIHRNIKRTCDLLGMPPVSSQELDALINTGSQVSASLINTYPPLVNASASVKKQWQDIFQNMPLDPPDLLSPFPEAISILSQHYRLCLLSNQSQKRSVSLLKHQRIFDYFDIITGPNPQAIRAKPAPDMFALVKDRYTSTSPSDFLMIGDTEADGLFARTCGIKFMWASYGYGRQAEISSLKPDYICDTPISVVQTLNQICLSRV